MSARIIAGLRKNKKYSNTLREVTIRSMMRVLLRKMKAMILMTRPSLLPRQYENPMAHVAY